MSTFFTSSVQHSRSEAFKQAQHSRVFTLKDRKRLNNSLAVGCEDALKKPMKESEGTNRAIETRYQNNDKN